MVSIEKVKKKIANVIEQYGNNITIRGPGVKTYDEWGEPVVSNQIEVQTVGVTDNYISSSMKIISAGRLEQGETYLLLKGDEDISKEHTVLINDIEYNVMEIIILEVSNVVVAKQVRLASK